MAVDTNSDRDEHSRRLFDALAHQLHASITRINHSAQALSIGHDQNNTAQTLTSLSAETLKMMDSYMLAQSVRQQSLALEPVALSAVLHDAAHELSKTAMNYNCKVELKIEGRHGPVMSRKNELMAAINMLGQTFMESEQAAGEKSEIVISSYRSRGGLSAGIFARGAKTSDLLTTAQEKKLVNIKQPLPKFSSESAAGIYLADILLSKISLGLHPAKHRSLQGMAATFMPSRQLNIV